jgi:hypothetical protein
MVERQGYTIVHAARKLRIKLPTAKVILKNYRKKGEVLDKPSTRRERVAPEALSEGLAGNVEGRTGETRENEAGGLIFEPYRPFVILLANYNAGFFPIFM